MYKFLIKKIKIISSFILVIIGITFFYFLKQNFLFGKSSFHQSSNILNKYPTGLSIFFSPFKNTSLLSENSKKIQNIVNQAQKRYATGNPQEALRLYETALALFEQERDFFGVRKWQR